MLAVFLLIFFIRYLYSLLKRLLSYWVGSPSSS